MKEPPTKSDEENCSVRYRIEPSGNNKVLHLGIFKENKCSDRSIEVKLPALFGNCDRPTNYRTTDRQPHREVSIMTYNNNIEFIIISQ